MLFPRKNSFIFKIHAETHHTDNNKLSLTLSVNSHIEFYFRNCFHSGNKISSENGIFYCCISNLSITLLPVSDGIVTLRLLVMDFMKKKNDKFIKIHFVHSNSNSASEQKPTTATMYNYSLSRLLKVA